MTEAPSTSPALALERSLLGRALAARDPGRLHVRFRAEVVDRYRGVEGAQLVRTRSVGRVALRGRWSVDLGITEDGREVHLPFADLVDRVPESEWPHWLEHLVETSASATFLTMRMTPAACIDDGETEPWTSEGGSA